MKQRMNVGRSSRFLIYSSPSSHTIPLLSTRAKRPDSFSTKRETLTWSWRKKKKYFIVLVVGSLTRLTVFTQRSSLLYATKKSVEMWISIFNSHWISKTHNNLEEFNIADIQRWGWLYSERISKKNSFNIASCKIDFLIISDKMSILLNFTD